MIRSSCDILNAFTVDVEDYYHVQAFADRIDPSRWDHFESRVVANTHKVLRIADEHQVRGTFFVLGWVADRCPQLLRDIQRSGHELGCHGYAHRLVYRMQPDEFRRDLVRARDAIAQIAGEPVRAYRAPSFSITQDSLWSLEILLEEGFRYDSSVFPVYHDKYGIPGAMRFPHVICRRGAPLVEFPPSVCRFWRLNVPVAGGGYFRLYPAWFSLRLLRRINHRDRQPFVFYIHPWELDPDQPRLPGSLRSRFRHYQNLRTTERKLRRLLVTFSFCPLSEALQGMAS